MLHAASGWWLGSLLFLLIWGAIAPWPARVAARKGHRRILPADRVDGREQAERRYQFEPVPH